MQSRERVLTGLDGVTARVRGMRERYSSDSGPSAAAAGTTADALENDTVPSGPGEFQLKKALRKSATAVRYRGRTASSSAKRPQGRVAKIIEAELSVVVPEDSAKPTQYYVVLNGDIDRFGSGVLEFYSKSSAVFFLKKYNLSKLPAHKLRIDEVSQTCPGTVQIVHAMQEGALLAPVLLRLLGVGHRARFAAAEQEQRRPKPGWCTAHVSTVLFRR